MREVRNLRAQRAGSKVRSRNLVDEVIKSFVGDDGSDAYRDFWHGLEEVEHLATLHFREFFDQILFNVQRIGPTYAKYAVITLSECDTQSDII